MNKKTSLDPAEPQSYRPISNLSVLSKTLERLVARQLVAHLNLWKLMPELQSAYRANHSTETAVLRVLADILGALDRGDYAVLTLLDLSAAFDTVDHATLLRRLQITYGICGTALSRLSSYLTGRKQSVRYRGMRSSLHSIFCGVPQGSVLGPILFLLYTTELLGIIQDMQLYPHLYADNTHMYGFCSPYKVSTLQQRMSVCSDRVSKWMRANRLQLNCSKTEVLWCASPRQHDNLPNTPLRIGNDTVVPVRSVRNLGIYVDSDMSM